ncbi:MAG: PspA/IM30 family protein, partial [Colwellia sp.]
SKDRDDLAKSALSEKQKCVVQVSELQDGLAQLDVFLNAVQEDSQHLQEKLQEAKRKQEAFALRQESAQVRLKFRERAVVYNIDEAIGKFERYQQKIDRVEAEIESYDFTANKDLDSQFRDLEKDETIEKELAALKKQVVNG